MLRLSRSLPPGWTSCVPCGPRVRFARVEPAPEGGRPVLRWVHDDAWDDPARALRHARRLGGLARRACVAVLPREQVQLLPMDAPDVPRDEWRAAVRWRLKDMVEFPVVNAGVDVLEIPAEASARRQPALIAVAAPGDVLQRLAQVADDAGMRWRAVDVAETALRNLSALLATPGRSHALLHLGETHGTLVITLGGELLQTRQIDITTAQLATDNEQVRQAAYERAGLELQRTLDGFERLFTHTSLERLQVLPGPGVDGFCEYVRDLVYVPLAEADLLPLLDCSALPALGDNQALAPYWVAIGAALRSD